MNFGYSPDRDVSPFDNLTPEQVNNLTEQLNYAKNQHTIKETESRNYYFERLSLLTVDDFITILVFTMPDGFIKTALLNIKLPKVFREITAGSFFDLTPISIEQILHKNTDGVEKNIFAAKILSKLAKLDSDNIIEKMAKQGFTVPH